MKKKLLILLVLLSILSLLVYVFTNTNILQGVFKFNTNISPTRIGTLDTSIITITKAGTGASEIDWSGTEEYTLGEWTVKTEKAMDLDLIYSYIGEPKSTSTSQNNYTGDYFTDTRLTITESNGTFDTQSITLPDVKTTHPLNKDTYTFTLTGKAIAEKEADFDANGFNGDEITLNIDRITTSDGTKHQQGVDDGSDYFTYDEKVTGNTAFSYGGYTITTKDNLITDIPTSSFENYAITDTSTGYLDVKLTDKYGNPITDIPTSSFRAGTSTSEVSNVTNNGKGFYLIEGQTSDNFYLIIAADGWVIQSLYGTFILESDAIGAMLDPQEIAFEYPYYVNVSDSAGSGVSAATVSTTGDLYTTACTEVETGVYACPAKLDSNLTYSVAKSGFDSLTGSFTNNRTNIINEGETVDVTLAAASVSPSTGTVNVTVYHDVDQTITGLDESAFTVSDGSTPSSFSESDGVYTLGLNYGDYSITVAPDGYVTGTTSVTVGATSDDGQTMNKFAYNVILTNSSGESITGATVSAGDNFDLTCVENAVEESEYQCAIPLAHTETGYKVEASGYESYTGDFSDNVNGLPAIRTSGTDASLYSYPVLTQTSTTTDSSTGTDTSTGIYTDTSSSAPTGTYSNNTSTNTGTIATNQKRMEILSSDTYTCKDPFTDTNGHWGEDIICRLYSAGIVIGRNPTSFVPDDNITRAEFLKMALLNAGFSVSGANGMSEDYPDVNPGDWFYPYVKIAESKGFLRNQGGDFHPNDKIKRGDAIVLSVRIARQTLYGYVQSDIRFNDVVTSDYFAYAVIIGSNTQVDMPDGETKSVIEGYSDGSFGPNNYISRAEAAAMTIRAYLAWYK